MMASISAWMESLNARPVLGVDIASDAVHLLELRGQAARSRITASASAPLPSGALVMQELRKPELVAAAIRQAMTAGGVCTRRSVIALPASRLLIRRLQLPAGLGDEELDELLRADAARYLPYPLDEACFDFEVLDTEQAEHTEIRLYACLRRELEARCEAARLAGLQVCRVDVERYALECAAAALLRETPLAAVLNFQRERSELLLLENGETVYAQDLSGSSVWQDADGQLQADGLLRFARQLQQTLAAALPQGAALQALLLAGRCRRIDRLTEQLSELLELPCHAARAQANVEAAALLAYGLARRGLEMRS